jgi:hydroxymethylpyrimidine pyrophosphatase-like HAD family hydrolase
MTFIIDIDNTLLKSEIQYCKECGYIKYTDAKPIQQEIDAVNIKYKQGHTIILHTGRGWNQYGLTKMQLKKLHVNHHELVCGKPIGIYIDTDAQKSIKDFQEKN